MNAKKLVLGFCALAAVTGAAAHGTDVPAAHQVPAEALAEMNEIAESYDGTLECSRQQELWLVRDALSNEHEAYLIF
jgi:hypothetical protein